MPFAWINTREQQEQGLSVHVSPVQRIAPESVDPTAKNYHWVDLRIEERALSRAEPADANEVFVTSTVGGIMPVCVIDGRPVGSGGPGPGTGQVRSGIG